MAETKERLVDKANSEGGEVSECFNDSMIGLPITGRTEAQVKANQKKYDLFGSAKIGSHFGRSGSPTGTKMSDEDSD